MANIVNYSSFASLIKDLQPKLSVQIIIYRTYLKVYTDGACTKNGQKGARAGIGVFWSNVGGTPANLLNVSEPVKGDRATNNVGEIQAITRCIDQAKEQVNVLITE